MTTRLRELRESGELVDLSPFRKRYPAPAPVETSLFATDEVRELVDTFPGERIVCRGGAEDSATGHYDSAPAIIAFFHPSLRWK